MFSTLLQHLILKHLKYSRSKKNISEMKFEKREIAEKNSKTSITLPARRLELGTAHGSSYCLQLSFADLPYLTLVRKCDPVFCIFPSTIRFPISRRELKSQSTLNCFFMWYREAKSISRESWLHVFWEKRWKYDLKANYLFLYSLIHQTVVLLPASLR
jgi:hypothetical protein